MSALSAVLLIFSFQFSLLLFHVYQPGSTAAYWFTEYETSDAAVVENLGQFFLYGVYIPRERFLIDSNGTNGN